MDDMLEQIRAAMKTVEGADDNLLRAIAALAAAGQITVMPSEDRVVLRPIILLPKRMYDRLLHLYGEEAD